MKNSWSKVSDALCQLGLPAHVVTVGNDLSVRDQVGAFAGAAVVVSVHGAQLTNLVWMRTGSAVVEVLVRTPIRSNATRFTGFAWPGLYIKADYANLARAFSLRYWYHDPQFVAPHKDPNPIQSPVIFVSARSLAAAHPPLSRSRRSRPAGPPRPSAAVRRSAPGTLRVGVVFNA